MCIGPPQALREAHAVQQSVASTDAEKEEAQQVSLVALFSAVWAPSFYSLKE